MTTPIPAHRNDQERLKALGRYAILDTPPEACFDRIIFLARELFDVPIAGISLIDESRQWFKARCGIELSETPRELSFCTHTILQDDVMVVLDARADSRFATNPFVTGDAGVRFYAGAPLIAPDGHQIGALCLLDVHPRASFSDRDRKTFATLAAIVVDELEMRVATGGLANEITQRIDAERRTVEARQLLGDGIEHVKAGIAIYGHDGRMRACNQRYWRSYRGDEPQPKVMPTFECLIRTAVADGIVEDVEALSDAAKEEWIEERLAQLDRGETLERQLGNGRHFLIEQSELSDGGHIIVQHEVTDLKQREAELHNTQEFLRGIFDNVQDGIVATDANGDLLIFNEVARRMHGLDQDVPPYDSWREYFDVLGVHGGHVLQRQETPLHRALAGDSIRGERIVISPKNGTPRLVSAHGQAMVDRAGSVQGAVVTLHDISAESAAEARYADLYNKTPVMLHSIDRNGRLISVSEFWLSTLGYERDEVLGRKSTEFLSPRSREEAEEVLSEFFKTGLCRDVEYQLVKKNGDVIDVLLSAVAEYDSDGEIERSLAVLIDVTERKEMEQNLVQAQKMEALGQLTGSLAHDFNNLLAVVLGNLQLLQRGAAIGDKNATRVEAAINATQRGAELTRHLLAFSRKEPLDTQILDIGAVVRDTQNLLAGSLGELVDLEVETPEGTWPILTDRSQLEAALLNVAVNARDAMPNGGRLFLRTQNLTIGPQDLPQGFDLAAGDYVAITMADTGEGMSESIRVKAFDPFFTTKGSGKGTGLGLSTVFGFAKQSNGSVDIVSSIGCGTTVTIYLPRAQEACRDTPARAGDHDLRRLAGTGELILVVDDNREVRETAVRLLRDLNYATVEAEDGPSALAKLETLPHVDLLFTDIVMPGGMSGIDLAVSVRTIRPALPILFASGFVDANLLENEKIDVTRDLINKPYRIHDLALRIRAALDSSHMVEASRYTTPPQSGAVPAVAGIEE